MFRFLMIILLFQYSFFCPSPTEEAHNIVEDANPSVSIETEADQDYQGSVSGLGPVNNLGTDGAFINEEGGIVLSDEYDVSP